MPPNLEQSLSAAERIVASSAPALMLALIVLFCVSAAAVWLLLNQRAWVRARIEELNDELIKAEAAAAAHEARCARDVDVLVHAANKFILLIASADTVSAQALREKAQDIMHWVDMQRAHRAVTPRADYLHPTPGGGRWFDGPKEPEATP